MEFTFEKAEKEYKNTDYNPEMLKLFIDFCRRNKIDQESVCSDVLKKFFLCELPSVVCQPLDEAIDDTFFVIWDFFKFCDEKYGTNLFSALSTMPAWNIDSALRMLYAKKELLRFIKSPVISLLPVVIDIDNYKVQKQREKDFKEEPAEWGYFEVADLFSNNSVVLKRLSGYTSFIRVYLNSEAANCLRPGDIMHIRVQCRRQLSSWRIDKVIGCYAPEAADWFRLGRA